MENFKIVCGIIASLISALSYLPYRKDIFIGKTQPHSYTWLIWVILQITAVIAMLHNGAGIGALPLIIGTVFCLYIFILSLKYGTKNITIFDTICLIGAFGTIGVYIFMHDPALSVILICVIDFVGFLPTLRKAYAEPHSETISMFSTGVISGTLTIIAISNYSIVTTLFPAYIVFASGLCTILLYIRRKQIADKSLS